MRRLVLGIAVAVTSLMPVIGIADDQQIADYIKSRLQAEQQQGNLRGFNVDMRVENGTVSFSGYVSNSKQEMTILRTAQQAGHLGVVKVVDDINVSVASMPTRAPQQVAQVVAQQPMPSAMVQQPMPSAMVQQPMPQPMPQAAPYQQISNTRIVGNEAPMPFANAGGGPVGPATMGAPNGMAGGTPGRAPNLPGYAWPGYAAHPNYAAVSYPKQYSASAWPYIGPFYPYPQVPLGWRKVSLEWDDGWWMLDFHDK